MHDPLKKRAHAGKNVSRENENNDGNKNAFGPLKSQSNGERHVLVECSSEPERSEAEIILDHLYEVFGRAVFLVIPRGKKRPVGNRWQALSYEQTLEPEYRAELLETIAGGGNLGVSLGKPSDNLHAIDIDSDELVEPFLALNPPLASLTRTHGKKGCQIFFRPKPGTDYPNSQAFYPLKTQSGTQWGEWRCGESGGAQSIILGIHPEGMRYRFDVNTPTGEHDFTQIRWPSGLVLPWVKTEPPLTRLERRIKAYLDTVDLAIEGNGGSNVTFRVSCLLVNGWSLNRGDAIRWMHYYSDTRCQPSWPDAEIEHKVDDALKATHPKPRGHLRNQQAEETESQAEEEAARKLESQAEVIAQSLDAYYDIYKEKYILLSKEQRWHPAGAGTIKQNLRLRGVSSKPLPRRTFSQADIILTYIQHHRDVYFCGSLAGRKIGFYQENGTRLLVTTQAELIEPKPTEWPTLQAILGGLFFDSEPENIGHTQLSTFHAWCRTYYLSLRDDRFAPGQILAICGPINCGKSFLQEVITYLFGGRATKGTLFLQGRTDFNSHLFDGEHVKMEDEGSSTSYPDRRALGEELKKIAVNRTFELHGKGDKALTIEARRRVTITLNDTAERIAILPPIGYDLEDKIIILHASDFDWPLPMDNSENQAACLARVRSELPGYIHFLLNEFSLHPYLFEPRMGVKAFQHPGILSLMDEISPGTHMLFLIDKAKPWEPQSSHWEGSAAELRDILLRNDSTKRDAESLLKYLNTAGTYLGLIAKSHPQRVLPQRTNARRWWVINAP